MAAMDVEALASLRFVLTFQCDEEACSHSQPQGRAHLGWSPKYTLTGVMRDAEQKCDGLMGREHMRIWLQERHSAARSSAEEQPTTEENDKGLHSAPLLQFLLGQGLVPPVLRVKMLMYVSAAARDYVALAVYLEASKRNCCIMQQGLFRALLALHSAPDAPVDVRAALHAGLLEAAIAAVKRHAAAGCDEALLHGALLIKVLAPWGDDVAHAVRADGVKALCKALRHTWDPAAPPPKQQKSGVTTAAGVGPQHLACFDALCALCGGKDFAPHAVAATRAGAVQACLAVGGHFGSDLQTDHEEPPAASSPSEFSYEQLPPIRATKLQRIGRLLRALVLQDPDAAREVTKHFAKHCGAGGGGLPPFLVCMIMNHGMLPRAEAEALTRFVQLIDDEDGSEMLYNEECSVRFLYACPSCAGRGPGAPAALAALAAVPGALVALATVMRTCVVARAPAACMLATLVQQDAGARAALRAHAHAFGALREALFSARAAAVRAAPHAASCPPGVHPRCLKCREMQQTDVMQEGEFILIDQHSCCGDVEEEDIDPLSAQWYLVNRCSLRVIDAALDALMGCPNAAAAAAEEAATRLLAEEETAALQSSKQAGAGKGRSKRRRAKAKSAPAAAAAAQDDALNLSQLAAVLPPGTNQAAALQPPADAPHEDDELCVCCLDAARDTQLPGCEASAAPHGALLCGVCAAMLLAAASSGGKTACPLRCCMAAR